MKKIIFTRPDGGVTVRTPGNPLPGESQLEQLARLVEDARAKAIDTPTVIDDIDLPLDRTLRNAWKRNNNKIEEDFDKAKKLAEDMGLTVAPSDKMENIRAKVKGKMEAGIALKP